MAIAYPSNLPPPMQQGYQLRHLPSRRQTDMANGRRRLRRVQASTPSLLSVSWLLTGAEFAQFEQWFYDNLFETEEWFSAPLLTSMGVIPIEVRFAGMYQPLAAGPRDWQLSATLETRERHTMPEEWLEPLAQLVPYFSIIDIAVNQHWPAE